MVCNRGLMVKWRATRITYGISLIALGIFVMLWGLVTIIISQVDSLSRLQWPL